MNAQRSVPRRSKAVCPKGPADDGKRSDLPLHKRVPPEHRVPLRACDVEGLRRLVRVETVGGQGGERATHSTLGIFLGPGSTTPIDALPEDLLICSTQ